MIIHEGKKYINIELKCTIINIINSNNNTSNTDFKIFANTYHLGLGISNKLLEEIVNMLIKNNILIRIDDSLFVDKLKNTEENIVNFTIANQKYLYDKIIFNKKFKKTEDDFIELHVEWREIIDLFKVSNRAKRILFSNFKSVEDMSNINEHDLLRFRDCGKSTASEIIKFISRLKKIDIV